MVTVSIAVIRHPAFVDMLYIAAIPLSSGELADEL